MLDMSCCPPRAVISNFQKGATYCGMHTIVHECRMCQTQQGKCMAVVGHNETGAKGDESRDPINRVGFMFL